MRLPLSGHLIIETVPFGFPAVLNEAVDVVLIFIEFGLEVLEVELDFLFELDVAPDGRL